MIPKTGSRSLSKEFTDCIRLLGLPYKVPWTGGLEQQEFICSQFWRLDVQDQGVGRFGFS